MARKLARVAWGAHGVVTRPELLAAGVTVAEIDGRVKRGELICQYRGVYRVGHSAPSVEAAYLAAVKACGNGALLSGRAAAHLLGLTKGPPPPPEVMAPTARRPRGVRAHRSRHLDSCDGMTWNRIPVTTVARTLVDLAARLSLDDLARACHEAGIRHKTTPEQIEAVLARRPNTPGAAGLRRVIGGDVHVTLSKLEARFLDRLRKEGLALPETNCPVGGRRVDCHWPEHRLTVELDGYRYHRSRHAWEQDRRREREAHARGEEFRRYTYGDVLEQPRLMLAELCLLLPRR